MDEKNFSNYPLGVKRSPIDNRDWRLGAVFPKITLPVKTDNRADMPPFFDQGDYPTCAAVTARNFKRWQEKKDDNLLEELSAMYVYNNRSNSDDGMMNKDLMTILQKKGICREPFYPYGSKDAIPAEADGDAFNFRIKNYGQCESLDALKTALYVSGPCVMAVPVYNYSERMWYQRPGEFLLGGHDMCLVDYNDEIGKLTYFNSWRGFGDNGYAYMDYDDFYMAWEFWSSVDMDSFPVDPEPEPDKKGCLKKIFSFGL